MQIAARVFSVAADQPKEALTDILGLAALCAMFFGGFVVTSMF
ncbi:MAG: hypothetical protein AAF401_12835 [Pseudomonadota bacterium]